MYSTDNALTGADPQTQVVPKPSATGKPQAKANLQKWRRGFKGKQGDLDFFLNIERSPAGHLHARYWVIPGSNKGWELEGTLLRDNTFVLRGSENSAEFQGVLLKNGTEATVTFRKGDMIISNVQLSQAPMRVAQIQMPIAPAETLQEGESANITEISAERRKEILDIPKGGYTSSETRQMESGIEIGSLNGVKGYYNGPKEGMTWGMNYSADGKTYYGYKWQCVEFVRRYTHMNSGAYIAHRGDAKTFYKSTLQDGSSTFDGFKQHRNHDIKTGKKTGSISKPKVGDVVVIGTASYGHVAIVAEVSDDSVTIAQQNVGTKFTDIISLEKKGERWIMGGNVECWLSKE